MIHGYISLSGLNSFLIVQNFANSAHPSVDCSRVRWEVLLGACLHRGLLGIRSGSVGGQLRSLLGVRLNRGMFCVHIIFFCMYSSGK